jgi:mRNA interferase MazF
MNTTTAIANTNVHRNTQVEKIHQDIQRGDIFMADLSGVNGQVQRGVRPVVIVSNSVGNRYSNIVLVAPVSSSITKKKMPTHVDLSPSQTGLLKESVLLTEQIRVLDQWCLMHKLGRVEDQTMIQVNKALAISIGLDSSFNRG